METDTLILGAGITGLSTAYHMEALKKDYVIIDAASAPGGLCRTEKQDGFFFDYSGHVIHTKEKYTFTFLKKLLGKNINLVKREAWIYLQNKYVPFPFQTNLFHLNANVVKECIDALLAAKPKKNPSNFKEWALSVYGEGICKYFMFPYNQKLWIVPPEELSLTWVNAFVPKTNTQDIVKGAYFENNEKFGYNTCFFYPKEGGIAALPNAMAKKIKNLHLNTAVLSVDLENKTVRTSAGEIKYKKLINTIPLKNFLELADIFEKERELLKHTSVYLLCLGINREIKNISWVYFPEEKFSFYRAGVQSAFSPGVAPKGCSALYIEFTGKKPKEETVVRQLKEAGILEEKDRVLTSLWLDIPVAYNIFDKNRDALTEALISALKNKGVLSAGRYGAWEYSFIEKNILDGKTIAEKI